MVRFVSKGLLFAALLAAAVAAPPVVRAAESAPWRTRLDDAERLADMDRPQEAVKAADGVLASAGAALPAGSSDEAELLARLAGIYVDCATGAPLPALRDRLAAFPGRNFGVSLALGRILRFEQKPAEAETALKAALALRPGARVAMSELARVYDDMGRLEEERALLETLAAGKRGGLAVYTQLARVDVRLGRNAEAKSAFARARASGHEEAGAYIAEGYFYLHSGHPAKALDAFEGAVAVDTSSFAGYHHLGAYYYTHGEYEKAETALRQALKLEETDAKATEHDRLHTMQWLGDTLEALARRDEAESLFREMLKRVRPGTIHQLTSLRSLARIYQSEGRTSEAEALLQRAALVCDPRSASADCDAGYVGRAMLEFGVFELSRGKKAEAEAMAKNLARLGDSVPPVSRLDVLRDLANLYVALGDAREEAALYAKLLPLRRKTPDSHDLVWVESGLAKLAAAGGRLREADERYDAALGVLDRGGYWAEEADMLDVVAALRDKEGRPADAAASRAKAGSLRARE